MNEKLLAWFYKIESNTIISCIRRGFILLIPLVLAGSLALLLRSIPFPPYQQWLDAFAGGICRTLLQTVFDATIGFLSVYLTLSISGYFADSLGCKSTPQKLCAMFTSLSCFLATFGGMSAMAMGDFGPNGVFTAIICAVTGTWLVLRLMRVFSHKSNPLVYGGDALYQQSMSAILPILLCVAVFALGNWLLSSLLHAANLNDLISKALCGLFEPIHGQLAGGLLYTFLLHILWLFGIHGGNAMEPVSNAFFVPADADPTAIVSKTFLDTFALPGGSGAVLCLLLAMLLVSRSRGNRRLAWSAAPMLFFNINESLIFGLPVVFNPVMIIPFVLVPVCSMLIAYAATVLGLMPVVTNTVTWTTPIFFSGYLATGSARGILIQILILLAGTAIYIPFIRFSEQLQGKWTAFMLEKLETKFREDEKAGAVGRYSDRQDNLGAAARVVLDKLRLDIENGDLPVYYQPIVDGKAQAVAAEALLRWSFSGHMVYPPLVVTLSKEDGCFDKLTMCVLNRVCRDSASIWEGLGPDCRVSVNITAQELDSGSFLRQVMELAEAYHMKGRLILEVTEETSLGLFRNTAGNMQALNENGILLAIDDFSMGQTSLDYLREHKFQYVKLDGSIVRQAADNGRCREIIGSLCALGKTLGFQTIAEFVENETLQDILLQEGCGLFQGYFYSPALPLPEIISRCKRLSGQGGDFSCRKP